jgi:hypothetical protein
MQQEPRNIGGTYHLLKADFSGLNFREYPHTTWPEIWYYCGWLRNPASPKGWLKHVETIEIMGCLPPFSTGAGFHNHPP